MACNHYTNHCFGKSMLATVIAVVMSIGTVAFAQSPGPYGAIGEVSKANTLFSNDFYNALRGSNPGNLICSPLSVSAVVAMLKGGARLKTAEEIQKTFQFPRDETLFSGYQALLKSLKSNENFTLEIANRVYAKTGFELNPRYVEILTQYFGAELEQLDFTQQTAAANKINGWVEQITQKRITNLISPGDLDALTRLVLVNGIYFKGKWKSQFDAKKTQDAPFYATPSNPVQVKMMEIETDLPYADIPALDAKGVSLPYLGDRLSMIVLLPNAKDGLAHMENQLKTFDLSSLPSLFRSRTVNLKMPKFKLESTLDLKNPLVQLGAGTMFDQNAADFSGIPKSAVEGSGLYVSKAVQKAFIEVNEEGSEAAAATGVMITLKSAIVPIVRQFSVDHPFAAFIYDAEADTYLFMSTVENPLSEAKPDLRSSGGGGVSGKDGAVGQQTTPWTLLSLGLLYALQRAL